MHVEIEAPEEFAGALMGDLNGRRGTSTGDGKPWVSDAGKSRGADG